MNNRTHFFLFHYWLRKYYLYQKKDSGYALVSAVLGIFLLGALLLGQALMSKVDTSSQEASKKSTGGFFAAEAGLNIRAKLVRDTFEGFNRPVGNSPNSWQDCIDGNYGNNGDGDFACDASQAFQGQTVATFVSESPDNPTSMTINPGELFAGLSSQEYRYDVTSVALDTQSLPTGILGMRFKSRLVAMFQFAAFYDKDLEILPGPPMTLSGPVHSNGDLYLDNNSLPDGSLTIEGGVSTAGKLYRGRKDVDICFGTVRVLDPAVPQPLDSCSSRTEVVDVASWNNQINLDIDPFFANLTRLLEDPLKVFLCPFQL